jgi:hypothetical protein
MFTNKARLIVLVIVLVLSGTVQVFADDFPPTIGSPTVDTAYFEQVGSSISVYSQVLAITYYNRGLAYATVNDQENAIADYTSALVLDSDFTPALFSRSQANELVGDHKAATYDLRWGLQIERDRFFDSIRG